MSATKFTEARNSFIDLLIAGKNAREDLSIGNPQALVHATSEAKNIYNNSRHIKEEIAKCNDDDLIHMGIEFASKLKEIYYEPPKAPEPAPQNPEVKNG